MDNCQLFMVAERQNRIKNNNSKMRKLKFEIDLLMPKIKHILELKDEYQKLEEHLKYLDNEYLIQKNKNILFSKSDKIEELVEQLQQKEEQIQFIQSLKKGFKTKKIISTLISSFKCYYQYKKQVAIEESEEDISLFEITYSYYKQYRILKNNNILFKTKEDIENMDSILRDNRDNILSELNQIQEEISIRRKILWNYPKKKEQMKNRMSEILSEIDQIHDSEAYKIYAQKTKRYLDLYNENQIYQGQIDNMMEMTKVKQFTKYRRSAA